jgi:hypothetical protein
LFIPYKQGEFCSYLKKVYQCFTLDCWSLQWIQQKDYGHLFVQSNAEYAINCFEHVVWDCFDYLQMWPNLFVNYIIRIRNAAAHALVSLVRNLCSRSWVGKCPWTH